LTTCSPAGFTLDGAFQFHEVVVADYLAAGMTVYDVGGGKHPFFGLERKARLGLHVCAIDITEQELTSAPPSAYDEVFCADICSFIGDNTADLVVCQAVLEHVRDTKAAIRGIASLLKPGAVALVFVPCRNALFARLNLLLPESWKKQILFTIFPETQQHHGFPAYYDRCTPRDFYQFGAIWRPPRRKRPQLLHE
jgi:2-polyprenyl-3-methyl-5-hydroxy-6-metoxy-1,4-benzoquinol methylase